MLNDRKKPRAGTIKKRKLRKPVAYYGPHKKDWFVKDDKGKSEHYHTQALVRKQFKDPKAKVHRYKNGLTKNAATIRGSEYKLSHTSNAPLPKGTSYKQHYKRGKIR